MATYSMSDLKKGLRIELDGTPYRIIGYQHVKPGKGAAFVRTKMKSLLDGKVLEKTFHKGDKAEIPQLEQRPMQYLYDDGEMMQFMDNETYDQIGLTYDQVGEQREFMKDGMIVQVNFHNDKPITVDIDPVVELEIVDTPPNFKGDSQGGKKPATLETGAVVQIPFHLVNGDRIKVDTAEGKYLEKAK